MIISLINKKGGAGKTTSAAYIASCLVESGAKVRCLDLDPDASLTKWSSTGTLTFPVEPSNSEDLEKNLVNDTDDFIVVDTQPGDDAVIYRVASFSDEIIVPLAATGLDLGRLPSTLRILADVERMRNKALVSVLLTRVDNRQSISKEAQETLSDLGVPLLDSRIRDLARYKQLTTPTYLDEYQSVLVELGVLNA
ncbi:ParA family protein [Candidatus Saccharibacteria bacterium]|nr:ParA family protein [Candidatus Saccharibacteria bacterium]